jgi:putative glutamine amidotransferase
MVISSPDHFFLCRLAFCRLRYLCFDIFFRRFLIKEPNSNLSTELQRKQPRSNPTAADEYRLANRAENRKLRTAYTPPAMRPIIGITSRQPFVETSGGQLRAHVVNEVYTAAVIRSGGTPILFPPVDPDEAPRLIDRLDGLVLSGGGDIDPALYGGKYFESMYMIDDFRDRFEFALVDEARSRRMPVLAICRGLQVVNVALGGSLIEDILSELGSSDHTVRGPGVVDCHQTVTIEAGTLVAEAIGSTEAVSTRFIIKRCVGSLPVYGRQDGHLMVSSKCSTLKTTPGRYSPCSGTPSIWRSRTTPRRWRCFMRLSRMPRQGQRARQAIPVGFAASSPDWRAPVSSSRFQLCR